MNLILRQPGYLLFFRLQAIFFYSAVLVQFTYVFWGDGQVKIIFCDNEHHIMFIVFKMTTFIESVQQFVNFCIFALFVSSLL